MQQKEVIKLSAAVFATVSAVHLLLIVFGLDITVGNFVAPLWLKLLAVLVAGYLSFELFKAK